MNVLPVSEVVAMAAALGLASMLHCMSMCGGFSLVVARTGGRAFSRLAWFHLGRVWTYVLIGGGFGRLGSIVPSSGRFGSSLSVAASVLLLLLGLHGLGFLPRLHLPSSLRLGEVGDTLRGWLSGKHVAGLVLFGMFNAFLPCASLWSALAIALASRSALGGMLAMLVFGTLSTAPLFGMGAWAGRLRGVASPWAAKVAPVLMLVMAVITFLRAGAGGVAPPCCHP